MTEGRFSDLPLAVVEAREAFQRADDAWGAKLRQLFGKRAGDVRYSPQGKGDPGSVLRALYEAREHARIAYDRACGRDERGRRIGR